jgi:ferric-dicitrate binding protein FerR (iron transport regulator)
MDSKQAKAILEKYRNGTCSPAEKQLVENWYAGLVETGEWQWGEGEKAQLEQMMEARLLQQVNIRRDKPVHRVHFMKSARWWAAASIILAVGLGGYFLIFDRPANQQEIVNIDEPVRDVKAPETNRAMVTLSDGRTVPLDSLSNGLLAQQGNVQLVKLADGQIAYQPASGEITTEIKYNTLFNPRGSKVIDMQLSDGSHIWLNAGSSVTYPVAFAGSERKVSITGEAYFEVAHDGSKPFYVTKGDLEVRVLGTHFNVNAYDNENDIKVTLLEGSVRVSDGGASALLQPNQQAIVQQGNVAINKTVDVEQVMAWKNGVFVFDGYAGIDAIMRQIERWYDVKVVYAGKVNTLFGGSVPRSANVSRVLKMLETTGTVSFSVENGTITVTPVKK